LLGETLCPGQGQGLVTALAPVAEKGSNSFVRCDFTKNALGCFWGIIGGRYVSISIWFWFWFALRIRCRRIGLVLILLVFLPPFFRGGLRAVAPLAAQRDVFFAFLRPDQAVPDLDLAVIFKRLNRLAEGRNGASAAPREGVPGLRKGGFCLVDQAQERDVDALGRGGHARRSGEEIGRVEVDEWGVAHSTVPLTGISPIAASAASGLFTTTAWPFQPWNHSSCRLLSF